MTWPPTRLSSLFAGAAALGALGFAAITDHRWEDYLITFRASLNLATGNGLVFQPGERVHTFTSPLGTLLPALFALAGGDDVAGNSLWGLRVVSALALAVALGLAVRAFQRDRLATLAILTVGTAWVCDAKMVDFSMNGMESALVIGFATLTWHAFAHRARVWPCALGFAGLQWTRPDGVVYFGALAVGWLVFGGAEVGMPVRRRCILILRAALRGGLLYLPWFVFAWVYYGSPVPHTIVAKAQPHSLSEIVTVLALYPWRLLFGDVALHDVFRPAYYFLGGWPESLAWPARFLAVGAALAWVWPRVSSAGRMASGAFFLGGFYLSSIPPFPWYYPGWQAIGWMAWAYLLHAIGTVRLASPWAALLPLKAARISGALIVTLQAGQFACVTWQMRTQQRLIEEGNRRPIGQWLREQARSGDTVFLEPLGYIGYYSGLKMLDYPGLSSPEVVNARKQGHASFAQLIETLQPDWLVLRPVEAGIVFREKPELLPTYPLVRAFDVRAAIDALPLLPGRGYLKFDAVFLVYHRIREPDPPP